ncbi:MAG: hypothetical protein IKG93_09035 [Clostridiales bacterium]|nr:hypothetical protein [Clostridiales bacterium]
MRIVSRISEKSDSEGFLSRKSNISKKRLTFFAPRKSENGKGRFPTAFSACFSAILSQKMKIADFRLTFSKKEFPNGAICKSFFAISTFATYLPHHTAQKALALQLPARSRAPSAPTRRAAAACLPAHQAPGLNLPEGGNRKIKRGNA